MRFKNKVRDIKAEALTAGLGRVSASQVSWNTNGGGRTFKKRKSAGTQSTGTAAAKPKAAASTSGSSSSGGVKSTGGRSSDRPFKPTNRPGRLSDEYVKPSSGASQVDTRRGIASDEYSRPKTHARTPTTVGDLDSQHPGTNRAGTESSVKPDNPNPGVVVAGAMATIGAAGKVASKTIDARRAGKAARAQKAGAEATAKNAKAGAQSKIVKAGGAAGRAIAKTAGKVGSTAASVKPAKPIEPKKAKKGKGGGKTKVKVKVKIGGGGFFAQPGFNHKSYQPGDYKPFSIID